MGFRDRLLSMSKSAPDEPPLDKKLSISKSNEKEAYTTPTREESPPPSYNPDDLLTPLTNLNLSQPSQQHPPTVDQCVVHLKFLTSLANLREDVSQSEGLFGISDSLAEKLSGDDKKEALPRIREKRWQVYVTRAVERFRLWWEICLPAEGRMLQQRDLSSQGNFHLITDKGRNINLGPDRAPPLGMWRPSPTR
jgi:hypothetical protein